MSRQRSGLYRRFASGSSACSPGWEPGSPIMERKMLLGVKDRAGRHPDARPQLTNEDLILLIRRTDNGNWAVPGGAIDLGESVAQAAVRETLEESGIECEITGIVGIYSDPRHVILYTSNGEVRQEFSIALTARALSGQPTPSGESSDVRWIPVSDVSAYTMDRSMRIRINDFLARGKSPGVC